MLGYQRLELSPSLLTQTQNNDIHRCFLGLNWRVLCFVRGSWKLVISDACGIANSAT